MKLLMPVCAGSDSALHRMEPRVKVVSIFGFVAVVSSLSSKPLLVSAAVMITALALISGLGAGYLLRRLILVLPFTGMVLLVLPFAVSGEAVFSLQFGYFHIAATDQGFGRAAILSLRVLTAVVAVNILTATTPFPDLMKALRGLKIPEVFVQVLEFTVRYIFVLVDEVQRMKLARKARCFKAGRSIFDKGAFRTLGQLVGVLFVRSWERGDRIYCAMLSRGYPAGAVVRESGARPGWGDLCRGSIILMSAVCLRLFESGALQMAMPR